MPKVGAPESLSLEFKELLLRGYLPIEEIERGLPCIRKRKNEHRWLILRSSPKYLATYSRQVIPVEITIKKVQVDEQSERKAADSKNSRGKKPKA